MSTVIGIVSIKGGVGKTTIAVHLAHYLHMRGEVDKSFGNVALYDGDPTEACTEWNQRGPSFPFPVIPRGVRPPGTKWLVVDTEAHPEEDALRDLSNILDVVILPVTTNISSINAAIRTFPAFARNKLVMTVVNDSPPRQYEDGKQVREFLAKQGLNPACRILYRRKAYEVACLEGVSVEHASQRAHRLAWLEFTEFGDEVIERWQRSST